ncbi:hypothetical protein GQ42DRAFT_103796, partial [Ramicandelaber brevisporus]
LGWHNVIQASLLLFLNAGISVSFGLGLSTSLVIGAVRCVIQLTIMGQVLEEIFSTRNPFIVLAMAMTLVLLGAYETTFIKAKLRHTGMFVSVLVSMYISAIVICLYGNAFAMEVEPYWEASKFIPTLGMLLGNGMGGIALGLNIFLTNVCDFKDRVEMHLSFGASRWEAARPIVVDAMKNALLPTINTMSITGLIAIPGMMTGQILGGAPVMDAVKYQQIILFMITASTSFGTLLSV